MRLTQTLTAAWRRWTRRRPPASTPVNSTSVVPTPRGPAEPTAQDEPAALTLDERVANLSPQRRALLYSLAEAGRAEAAAIPRADRSGPVPASFAQQRLWFIDRLEPGNCAYNCPIAIRLVGDLDRTALSHALTAVVRRQEALRTTFDLVDGEVVQVVRAPAPLPLPVRDLSGEPAPLLERRVAEAVAADLHRPFDLVGGPVIRAELMRLGPQEHVFLYDVHHIANDGWSVGVFLTELAELYSAAVEGREPDLPQLPVQYADYAAWQRARMTDALVADQSGYWRQRLDGLARLDLPVDLPRRGVQSPYGAIEHLDLPVELIRRLTELGRAEGASAFMSLMAICAVLLMRYSGQEDVPIGTAATDRDRSDLRNLVGFFPNTVIVRCDLSGGPTFIEVLRRVRDAARGAYAHADLPFDLLVRELAPQREPGRTPLFDVFFTVDETPGSIPGFSGLRADTVLPDVLTAKFDVGFTVRLDDDTPSVHCAYSTDLYRRPTIVGLLESFRSLLVSVVTDPHSPVTEADVLGPERRRRVLYEWNDTVAPFPEDSCLHHSIEAAAARQPSATAVVSGTQRWDFARLLAAASSVARRLREQGVGPGHVVGVCVSRSPEWVAANLGVLKAGAAYLPLDPGYPPERLAFMVRDAGAWGILVDERQRDRFVDGERPVVTVTGDGPDDAAGVGPAIPGDIAYVIYTSGSTGVPKGIELRHRGAVNNFHDFNTRFGIGPGDRLLGVSSPSFDMSVYDTLGFLGAGGTLVLPDPDAGRDPAQWADLLIRHRVTVWHSAPALLELVLDQLERDGQSLPSLRLALLGGDWIPLSMPGRLRALAPQVRFIALGGATESSMDSTIFEVDRPDPQWTSIPYGRPMANQRTYILDENRQPVPPGVPGELYLAGAGLARGYLGRPELTAERFIWHAFAGGPTDRLYRTGDRARFGHDGLIELLGRVDFQVKIRGLRIEPGEVEAAMRAHPGVGDAVVVARGERGARSLAGFYVPDTGVAIDESGLRQWLGQRLPSYMVPALLVALPELPTTPNGKIDRRSLSEYTPPLMSVDANAQTELQALITRTWQQVLGIGEFSLDDNFFDLGGDSFAAIRCVVALDRRVPVIELFKNPTVRSLAAHIEASPSDPALGRGRLLQRLGRLRSLSATGASSPHSVICVPYGGGNPIAYQPLADALPPEWSVWTVALPGHDNATLDEPFLSIDDAAQRCADEAMETITGPITVYGQCAGVALAVRIGQVLEERGADVAGVFVGAALPDPDPEASQSSGASITDEQIHATLSSLGGFDGALEWTDITAILRAVRHDAGGASQFFLQARRSTPVPLRAPLHCVFGDKDPATEGYATRYAEWEPFGAIGGVHVVCDGGHYFVRDHPERVARLLTGDET